MDFMQLLSQLVTKPIERAVKEAVSPVGPYMKKLAIGLVLCISSVVAFAVMLLSFAFSIYYGFAGSSNWWAALETGFVFLIIGALILIGGLLSLRRPR